MAVVRQEQLHRGVGQHGAEGAFDDIDDLGLAFRHVQRVGEAALEALALHLGVTDDRLPVRRRDGLGELVVQVPHLLVGEPLPALAENDQAEGEREHQCHDQADRHQVPVEPRRDRVAGHHGRHEDQRERTESDDWAEQAEALRLRDLPAPFLLCDHFSPIPSDTAGTSVRSSSANPGCISPREALSSPTGTTFRKWAFTCTDADGPSGEWRASRGHGAMDVLERQFQRVLAPAFPAARGVPRRTDHARAILVDVHGSTCLTTLNPSPEGPGGRLGIWLRFDDGRAVAHVRGRGA